ncbi:hypothetical protein PORY_001147 [Pneumocystis oryctolagi]|uniref:Uncharacterized protein n=1 Tax=Pneumocystis oryctolagi TaxID=42067 RepID=A0ACB7CDF2_9ASCO|nr:hypothetical protein PORY_001147 [Pneumocystis oryctolagi]
MEDEKSKEEEIDREEQVLSDKKDDLNISFESAVENSEKTRIAEEYKLNGNEMFRQEFFDAAVASYQKALDISSPNAKSQRAVYHANIAACYIHQKLWDLAVDACTQALKEDPYYIKALHRRAQANEKIATWSSLNAALLGKKSSLKPTQTNIVYKDYENIEKYLPQTSPILKSVRESISRVKPKLSEAQEREKAQVLSQLKNLGNNILGKFGLSTDNFKVVKNAETGGYSISFQN